MLDITLQEMRRKRGWTQGELALRSTVPQPMISMIESRRVKDPQVGTLYKLARALHCTVDDLVRWTDD